MLKNTLIIVGACCTVYCIYNGLMGSVFKQTYSASSKVVKTVANEGKTIAESNGLKPDVSDLVK